MDSSTGSGTESSQSQFLSASRISCTDGISVGACRVTWSDGQVTLADTFGIYPRTGGVVDYEEYFGNFGYVYCIYLFAGGGIFAEEGYC